MTPRRNPGHTPTRHTMQSRPEVMHQVKGHGAISKQSNQNHREQQPLLGINYWGHFICRRYTTLAYVCTRWKISSTSKICSEERMVSEHESEWVWAELKPYNLQTRFQAAWPSVSWGKNHRLFIFQRFDFRGTGKKNSSGFTTVLYVYIRWTTGCKLGASILDNLSVAPK